MSNSISVKTVDQEIWNENMMSNCGKGKRKKLKIRKGSADIGLFRNKHQATVILKPKIFQDFAQIRILELSQEFNKSVFCLYVWADV